jgi:hypothetical protein
MNPYSAPTTVSPLLLAAYTRGVTRAVRAYRRERAWREGYCARCLNQRPRGDSRRSTCRACRGPK